MYGLWWTLTITNSFNTPFTYIAILSLTTSAPNYSYFFIQLIQNFNSLMCTVTNVTDSKIKHKLITSAILFPKCISLCKTTISPYRVYQLEDLLLDIFNGGGVANCKRLCNSTTSPIITMNDWVLAALNCDQGWVLIYCILNCDIIFNIIT